MGVIWDLSVETVSAYFGWWTYNPGFGPEIHFARGNQPLLWPLILLCIWPNFMAYVAGKPHARGINPLERALGLSRFVRVRQAPEAPVPALASSGIAALTTGSLIRTTTDVANLGGPDYDVVGSRWKFDLARFGAWMLTFQVSFFVILIVPLVSLRLITGHNSIYAP